MRFSITRGPATKVAGLLLGVALALAVPRPSHADIFEAHEFTLPNGLDVVVVPNHLSPVVVQAVAYKAGAADGLPGKNGIAHFLEHLMFKGTDTLAPGQFSREIDKRGGSDNAYTSQDVTVYHQEIAKEHLELVMKMEADRMVNLRLTDAIVLPERDVILQERGERIDNQPGGRLGEAVDATLYLNHPYRLPVIGWRHEMERYTTEDALAFYKRFYSPSNAVLVVGGDVTVEDVRKLAEKYFGPLPKGADVTRERLHEPPPAAPRRVSLSDERVRQPYLVRSYLAPNYRNAKGNEGYALTVLSEILTGGSAGRLYRRMVIEQQSALAVDSGYDGGPYDIGRFNFYATPRQGGDLAAVEQEIDRQIAAVLKDGVTDQEVADAKRRLQISAVKARDSVSGPVFMVADALGKGRTLADVQAWPERIGAVTAADVLAAATQIFKPANSVTGTLLPKPAQEAAQP
ncbi:M16 family metallopeptidase [Dongia deserti]|uniref:M16 family metallopeptidase n=1 Tax=Dongia deserti TaxID=2268030 RepID=UPI0013C5219E|nr:pitrilysin family protein [Dongia deserti]